MRIYPLGALTPLPGPVFLIPVHIDATAVYFEFINDSVNDWYFAYGVHVPSPATDLSQYDGVVPMGQTRTYKIILNPTGTGSNNPLFDGTINLYSPGRLVTDNLGSGTVSNPNNITLISYAAGELPVFSSPIPHSASVQPMQPRVQTVPIPSRAFTPANSSGLATVTNATPFTIATFALPGNSTISSIGAGWFYLFGLLLTGFSAVMASMEIVLQAQFLDGSNTLTGSASVFDSILTLPANGVGQLPWFPSNPSRHRVIVSGNAPTQVRYQFVYAAAGSTSTTITFAYMLSIVPDFYNQNQLWSIGEIDPPIQFSGFGGPATPVIPQIW